MSVRQLRRFAAECGAMANGTRDHPRDKQVWRGLAERWLSTSGPLCGSGSLVVIVAGMTGQAFAVLAVVAWGAMTLALMYMSRPN
jgi:hypothetical protein